VTVQLDPMGNAVQVGRAALRAPGLAGRARSLEPGPGTDLRAAEDATEALETALAAEGVEPQQTIEITEAAEIDAGAAVPTRSTHSGEPALVLEVPHPGDGWGQVVLAIDEAGVTTWNLPRDERDRVDVTRGGDTLTYVIRRHVPPVAEAEVAATRGLAGAVGRKLLKVLVFPLLDRVVGEVSERFAERWEERKRPYRARSFTPEDFTRADAARLDAGRWRALTGGPALLLLHGTFSRAHTAFGGLDPDTVRALHERYAGRVLAFDHFTLSHDPKRNVERLVAEIPEGTALDLDVMCHSRGGLVARVLAERQGELSLGSRALRVRRVVFAATPNAGTVLADGERMGDFVDRYTTLLNLFPDNGVTEVLEGVITVVKQLAVGALGGLDGLQAMRPSSPFLAALNEGPAGEAAYFALTANFEPASAGLRAFLRDRLMDRVFRDVPNDLVVPTGGVWETNGSGCFPIDDRHEFATADAVHHSGFFAHRQARERILGWLGE